MEFSSEQSDELEQNPVRLGVAGVCVSKSSACKQGKGGFLPGGESYALLPLTDDKVSAYREDGGTVRVMCGGEWAENRDDSRFRKAVRRPFFPRAPKLEAGLGAEKGAAEAVIVVLRLQRLCLPSAACLQMGKKKPTTNRMPASSSSSSRKMRP